MACRGIWRYAYDSALFFIGSIQLVSVGIVYLFSFQLFYSIFRQNRATNFLVSNSIFLCLISLKDKMRLLG